ncbi:werner syndrome-like exonuclease-like, partial [Trifolium medium]|nr:werner syndrome-like exonuclease-like [Trifolium medium]
MGYVKSFNLNGIYIETTVTNERNVIDDHISRFERQVNDYDNCMTKFFGFDTEWRVSSYGVACCQCAISLADGRSCLIIPLSSSVTVSIPQSLVNFLSHPNYTFVGIGIKDNVTDIKNVYGIGCRNAVELGPWAARVYCSTRMSYYGVD